MKTKISLLFALTFMLFNVFSCKSQSLHFNEEIVKNMLKDFYTSYIIERSKMPENFEKIDSIVNKYCTKELQNYIKNEDIDYDLFLNGQFCERKWLNTIAINKESKDKSIYIVSFEYIADSTKKKKNIKLQIVNNDAEYKINKVIE